MNRPFIFFLLLLISCSKDPISQNDHFLKNIEYSSQYSNSTWNESYIYNESSLISDIENSQYGYIYEITYENSSPVSISQFREGKLFRQDKFSYTEDGNITTIELTVPNDEGELESRWVYEYSYDESNRVIQKSNFNVISGDYTKTEKYLWSGGKINKREIYYQSDHLAHEYLYEYDNKKNYKKDIAIYMEDPLNWGEHNVSKSEVIDHSGSQDLICYECTFDYTYNSDDYPTEIIYSWGRVLSLTYE